MYTNLKADLERIARTTKNLTNLSAILNAEETELINKAKQLLIQAAVSAEARIDDDDF